MQHYDPLEAPDPEEWLALDEQERLDLVQDYQLCKSQDFRISREDMTVMATAQPGSKDAEAASQRLRLQTDYGQAVMWSKGFAAEETKAAFAHARARGQYRQLCGTLRDGPQSMGLGHRAR